MLLVVPYDEHGLPNLLEHLLNMHHRSKFDALFNHSHYNKERIELALPKFKLGADGESMDLREPVSLMGAAPMFDKHKAEFERITTKEKLHVSSMLHKAMIEVSMC